MGCGLVAFLLVLFLSSLYPFQVLEWKTWDLRERYLTPPERGSPEIVLVMIDQPSLDFYAQQGISWPWPRQMYAAVLDFLCRAQAKAAVIDLIMSEPSAYGVEDDQLLAEAIKRQGRTFLTLGLTSNPSSPGKGDPLLLHRFTIQNVSNPKMAVVEAGSVIAPVPELLQAAHGVGNVLFLPDDDSIFRRLPLLFRWNDMCFPALPLSLARDMGAPWDKIPLDRNGKMVILFPKPDRFYSSYSIAAIINSWARMQENQPPTVDPAELADKIVFIGTSAPGLLDLRPTPINSVTPGVLIHAAALDNLLHGEAARFLPRAISWLLVLVFALLSGLGVSYLSQLRWIGLFFGLGLIIPFFLSSLLFLKGYWAELVPAELAIIFSFLAAALLNYNLEGRERRFLKNVFRHYLSPEVIEKIISNPSLLKLGGESRVVTSFFSDVAGFSSLAEKLSPEELVRWMNLYLSAMTEIILAEGGTLDKYEGDAIIAFWNAPLNQPDHALRACRAALSCEQKLKNLAPELERLGGRPKGMRIGLNTGPAVVGNMGSVKRFDYTAMGDTINLASRLEGAAKFYQVTILIGESTYQAAKEHIVARPVDVIRVVGKMIPVTIYELIALKGEVAEEKIESLLVYERAWRLYLERDWAGALSLFSSLKPDHLATMYAERCQKFRLSPPSPDWDGVYELKEK